MRVLQAPQPGAARRRCSRRCSMRSPIPVNFVLVLDDYHVIDEQPVDEALTF